MRVIDKDTGSEFSLHFDEEVLRDLAELDNRECRHSETSLVQFTAANGSIHIRRCCIHCGQLTGISLKREPHHASLPNYSPTTRDLYEARRERKRSEVIQKHVRLQRDKDSEFWRDYNEYLASDAWKIRRQKVLRRSGGLCEGCLERPATEVHHTTYDNVFDELLFQLRALCKECHDKCRHLNAPVTEDIVAVA